MRATVKNLGRRLAVVIPKAIAKKARLTAGMSMDVSVAASGVVLRKQGLRPRRPLGQLVTLIDPAAYRRRSREFAGDHPIGKEVS